MTSIDNSGSDSIRSGLRLKKARLMAGFTRQALESKYGISVNTLQAWESAKSPLSFKGANKIIQALQDSGLECSIDWLLHGIGPSPRLNDEINIPGMFSLQKQQNNNQLNWDDESAILREVECFRTSNLNSIVSIVTDDSMLPIYFIGDYVGGKRKTTETFDKYIGINCLIETIEGMTIIRRLERGNAHSLYTLSCINPNTTVPSPVLYNVKIISIAPIIWHRRKDS